VQSPFEQQLVVGMQTWPHALVPAAHVHVLLLHEKPPAHPASLQQSSPRVPHVAPPPSLGAGPSAVALSGALASLASALASSGPPPSPGDASTCVASAPLSTCRALASGVLVADPCAEQPHAMAAPAIAMARPARREATGAALLVLRRAILRC
jgi:hypothetical protein